VDGVPFLAGTAVAARPIARRALKRSYKTCADTWDLSEPISASTENDAAGRLLHLAALVMVAISIALIMAPAAYHRQAEPDSVSRTFARYASSLVTLAMAPLMLAIAIEVALVTFSIKPWLSLSAGLGAMVAVIYLLLGYVLPRIRRPHKRRR